MAADTSTHDNIALFDLDGTLAEFDGAMRKKLRRMGTPAKLLERDRNDLSAAEKKMMSYRRKVVRQLPGFWRDLPRLEAGFDVLKASQELGFECHALTKGPRHNPTAWSEKVEWCMENIPDIPVTIAQKKSLVYGRVLVDDWPDYFLPWLEVRPRGLVIAVAQPWNAGVSHTNLIRYDGSNFDEVKEALQKARLR